MARDMLFQVLAFAAVFALIAASVVRIRIFRTAQYDEIAAPLLDDTFPTTFSDFLWVHLYRQRARIGEQHRLEIVAYFWLTVLAIVLLLAAFLANWVAA